MRRTTIALILLSVVLLPALRIAGQDSIDDRALAITRVTVIDATGSPPQLDMTVVVKRGRIVALGRAGKTAIPKGAQVIEATGKFLIPGLWDMHVHTAATLRPAGNREIFFPLFIAHGVTGIRDMGGFVPELSRWRDEIESGAALGPRMVFSGSMLDGPPGPISLATRNEESARQAVDYLKRHGADFIKVQGLLSREAYFAIAAEAKKRNMPFAGHVPDPVTALEASKAGQASIEHLTRVLQSCAINEEEQADGWRGLEHLLDSYSEEKAAALFAAFVKNKTWHCPTLVWEHGYFFINESDFLHDTRLKYIPDSWEEQIWKKFRSDSLKGRTAQDAQNGRRRFEKELEVVGSMQRAGVGILAGTDTAAPYVFPGFSLHEELQWLVKAGLTPMEALQAATRNPARFLKLDGSLGTIEKGKLADLVLLEANPLDDIRNTQRIAAVIARGKYLDKQALNALLDRAATAASR